MLRHQKSLSLGRKLTLAACTCGMLFQLGSCIPTDVTTVTTVNGRDVLLNFLRAFVIAPIDAALVGVVDSAIGNDD